VYLHDHELPLSIDTLTARAVLLHDLAMDKMQPGLEMGMRRCSAYAEDDTMDPATRDATLDVLRSVPPSTNTPPERHAAMVQLRAEILKLRRNAGHHV
jgi:hypothetical protein